MWRELVGRVCLKCAFAPPASEPCCKAAEVALGVALPPELCALLMESNGIRDGYGDGILSVEKIIAMNLEMRRDFGAGDLYMSFDSLLFFSEAGNGGLFFFPIQGNGKINNPDVFLWNHENDSRVWAAGSLSQFVEKWYGEQLRV